jgi:GT2 family glycosyltransferase
MTVFFDDSMPAKLEQGAHTSKPAPSIAAVSGLFERPFLSVMIPTWRPHPSYLERAIRSVLGQLEDGQKIEIALVDDCSTEFDPYAFVERFDSGAVSVHRHDRRLGLAGNWNACLAEARGRWVHLLHQDDFVLPGFYKELRRGIDQAPTVAAAFCASHLADDTGIRWTPRLVPMATPGILDDWLRHVFVRLSIQCSAIVVRRDVYETLGGFDPDFSYALDWDMWKRIAARYPIWYHPEPLACYRLHPDSETARQRQDGSHLAEIFRSIDRSEALLPPVVAARVARRARSHYAVFAIENAFAVIRSPGDWKAARRHLRIARQGSSFWAVSAALVRVAVRGGVGALTHRGRRRS